MRPMPSSVGATWADGGMSGVAERSADVYWTGNGQPARSWGRGARAPVPGPEEGAGALPAHGWIR